MGTPDLCFANLKTGTVFDFVKDGVTAINGYTLEQVRAKPGYEDVEPMTLDAFMLWKAAQQGTPIHWTETTEDRFYEMLGAVPPVGQCGRGFLVGEPYDHCARTVAPRFQAFAQCADGFFASSRPITVAEWRAVRDKL